MKRNNKGFSLIELLITLAIIAALVAVVTPLAMNAIRSAKATKASANLKSISNSIYNYFYVENDLPTDMNELVRDLNEETYGVAYKENEDGTFEYVAFTSDNADLSKMHELLPNISSTIPEDEEYTFLSNGRDTFENLVAKYILTFSENGLVGPGAGNLIKSDISDTFSDQHDWEITEEGYITLDGDYQSRGIFNGDETAENYTVNVVATYLGDGNGYGIYVRASGTASNINGYCFQVDEHFSQFIVRIVNNGNEGGVNNYIHGLTFSAAGLSAGLPQRPEKHNISITANGNHFTMKFNGVKVLDFYDDTFSQGWVGLRQWDYTDVIFESVNVN